MLIKALCDHYDYLEKKGMVTEAGFSYTPIHYMIMLTPNGEVADIVDMQREVKIPNAKNPENPKTEKRPRKEKMPFREKTTSIKSYKLDHRSKYIFGLSYNEKGENFVENDSSLKLAHEKFCECNLEFIEGIDTPIVNAYRNFILNWNSESETKNEVLSKFLKKETCEEEKGKGKEKNKNTTFGDFEKSGFCFSLTGHPELKLHEDLFIVEKIRENEKNKDPLEGVDTVCGVTGKRGRIAELHRDIKGIAGQKAGTFVCVNNSAGESYGKKNAYTSNISEETVAKYTEAFNILAESKDEITQKYTNKVVIDGVTVLFFANDADENDTDALIRCLALGDDTENAEKINNMLMTVMQSARQGIPCNWSSININPNVNYYIAGFTPNSSRVSLKFLHHNKVGDIFTNVAVHQNDLAVGNSPRIISINAIARELTSPKSSNSTVSPSLTSNLFDSIFFGKQYPMDLLATVIRRVKTDNDDAANKNVKINATRVGIIKACLNRKNRITKKKEDVTMSLDVTNTNAGYLCGRLFALLERTQNEAVGDVNSGIKDKFFSAACSRPSTVFPRLLTLSQAHLSKLDDSKKAIMSASISNIMNSIGSQFPRTLSLEDQGRFIIGYYHQRYYKKNRSDNEQQCSEITENNN